MADFDVGALSLSSPPPSAVIQAYRPAVLVRNNGVHDALASGSLRIYSPAGLLIHTTEIYSGTLAPGETGPAQAVTYWTPPALGRYMVIAYVICANDQYEPNNNLAPVYVDVIPGEPEPPSVVPLHAAQHEEGGTDELNIDGLHGRATDAQTAIAHKASHQVAGSDMLDLTGMLGVLGTPQPIADHAQTHESTGGDRLNVDGLHGVLYNLQKPQVHANEAHDPNFATDAELDAHKIDTTDVHEPATNLEHVANKGEPDGYPELDEYGHIPPLRMGTWTTPPPAADKALTPAGIWDYPTPAAHHESHESGGSDEIAIPQGLIGANGASRTITPANAVVELVSLVIPANYISAQTRILVAVAGRVDLTGPGASYYVIKVLVDGTNRVQNQLLIFPARSSRFAADGSISGSDSSHYFASLKLLECVEVTDEIRQKLDDTITLINWTATSHTVSISFEFEGFPDPSNSALIGSASITLMNHPSLT
jgi:hypothetical protein